ncbi:tail completion protein gp17 [Pseudoxanthomonas indica]|uniref:DUF3168 domain-containing protein n=1 Tax=Pseudoxanthomonas indica TaxID=428993 RepID=A0A1T5JC39_9GAMM|nr:DUF3168 domain-containing protein [Pseudoxanthomonas indica]GGD57823.1 hypothetical protein GCM10007235_32600 [Pseudoxanthomonas indica]SKC48808.1 Protein of unknown function [Pseudoxanthomonas indica]
MFPPIYQLVAADAACKAVLGTPPRCYFGLAEENAARPYVVWHLAGGSPENLLDGPPPHDHFAGQVDIVADDQTSYIAAVTAVRAALERVGNVTSYNPGGKNAETGRLEYSFDAEFHVTR